MPTQIGNTTLGDSPAGSAASSGLAPAFEPVTSDQNSQTQAFRSYENELGQQGASLYSQGTEALGPVLNQLQKLASGNVAEVNQATAPEQDQISDAFAQVRQMIGGLPRSGGKASAAVQAPYQEIKQRSEARQNVVNNATGELGSLGAQLAGLGVNTTNAASAATLTARGQDNSNNFSSQFQQIASGLQSLI